MNEPRPCGCMFKAYEIVNECAFHGVIRSALAHRDQTVAELRAENRRLKVWSERLEKRMRETNICLCTFSQKVVGDGCSICRETSNE